MDRELRGHTPSRSSIVPDLTLEECFVLDRPRCGCRLRDIERGPAVTVDLLRVRHAAGFKMRLVIDAARKSVDPRVPVVMKAGGPDWRQTATRRPKRVRLVPNRNEERFSG
jgi:hypothetical protein